MKKLIFTLIISIPFLTSCLSDVLLYLDPLTSFENEMELRKQETAEQTEARQNKTLRLLKDKAIQSGYYMLSSQIPSTCKEANADLKQFFEKFYDALELEEKYKKISEQSKKLGKCSYCRSSEYASVKTVLEDIKKIEKLDYFGRINPSNINYNYILRVIDLCQQDDTRVLFEKIKKKTGDSNEAYFEKSWYLMEAFGWMQAESRKLLKECNEYDLNFLKKMKEGFLKVRQAINNGKYPKEYKDQLMIAEESCHSQYWGASERQCRCMVNVMINWQLDIMDDLLEAKEKCEYDNINIENVRIYNGFKYTIELKRKIRQKCGLE